VTDVTLAVVAGTTATAAIDGISAAGADPELRKHTPSADIEIVADGRPAPDSVVPSPLGLSDPAVVTRAVRELVGFEFVGVDAGLAVPTAPTGGRVLDAGAARRRRRATRSPSRTPRRSSRRRADWCRR